MKNIFSLSLFIIMLFTTLVGSANAQYVRTNSRIYTPPSYNTQSYNEPSLGYDDNNRYIDTSRSNNQRNYSNNTRSSEPRVIYVYQTVPSGGYGYGNSSGGYPGCNRADIVIGGQIWAPCNVAKGTKGSSSVSGWFFANDQKASFVSENGQ